MDTKHIHCMLEKISEYGKCMMEAAVGSGNVNLCDAGQIVDMVKDLACAEKDALIAKEMRKAHEEDEAEEKYIRKMLKEENKDEFKRYMEEYGDDGERRFYDDWRYKSSGRFAPKGRGSYRPASSGRRGYDTMMPMDYDMEDYNKMSPAERMRDLDRMSMGRMYYTTYVNPHGERTGYSESGNSGSQSGNMGGGNLGGSSSRGYEEYQRGYSEGRAEGYEQGNRDGRRSGNNSQSRSDRMRRNYTENKHMNDNSPEGKKKNMENLDSYMKELAGEMTELVEDMDASEKNMLKTRLQTLVQKIQ